jgi:hypothetical protein
MKRLESYFDWILMKRKNKMVVVVMVTMVVPVVVVLFPIWERL